MSSQLSVVQKIDIVTHRLHFWKSRTCRLSRAEETRLFHSDRQLWDQMRDAQMFFIGASGIIEFGILDGSIEAEFQDFLGMMERTGDELCQVLGKARILLGETNGA